MWDMDMGVHLYAARTHSLYDSQVNMLVCVCVRSGAGPVGGVCEQAGGQPSGPGLGGAPAGGHREEHGLRPAPAGAGLHPQGGRYLQVHFECGLPTNRGQQRRYYTPLWVIFSADDDTQRFLPVIG